MYKNILSQYIEELHKPLPKDDEGEDDFDFSHEDSNIPIIQLKNFPHESKEKHIIGKRYSDTFHIGRTRWTILSRIEREFVGVPVPFGGYKTVYELYFDGKYRGYMETITIGEYARHFVPENVFSFKMFDVLDAEFDSYPLFEPETLERLDRLSEDDCKTLSFWNKLTINKEDRGKGFAEILMRNAVASESDENGMDVMFFSAWEYQVNDDVKNNSKKQNSLNQYYKRFLEGIGFRCEFTKRNGVIASMEIDLSASLLERY